MVALTEAELSITSIFKEHFPQSVFSLCLLMGVCIFQADTSNNCMEWKTTLKMSGIFQPVHLLLLLANSGMRWLLYPDQSNVPLCLVESIISIFSQTLLFLLRDESHVCNFSFASGFVVTKYIEVEYLAPCFSQRMRLNFSLFYFLWMLFFIMYSVGESNPYPFPEWKSGVLPDYTNRTYFYVEISLERFVRFFCVFIFIFHVVLFYNFILLRSIPNSNRAGSPIDSRVSTLADP